MNAAFETFLASARLEIGREAFMQQTGEELRAGEVGVIFAGSLWAVRCADGVHRTVIERDEPRGTLREVAAALYAWGQAEGLIVAVAEFKVCGCGRSYTREMFTALPLVGFNTYVSESETREKSIAIFVVEQRDCQCLSTLAITHVVEIGEGRIGKDDKIS